MRGFKYLSYLTNLSGNNMALLLTIYCVTLLVQASLRVGAQKHLPGYHPVPTNESRSTDCNEGVLLMEHMFSASYGKPFVGKYEVERSIETCSCYPVFIKSKTLVLQFWSVGSARIEPVNQPEHLRDIRRDTAGN